MTKQEALYELADLIGELHGEIEVTDDLREAVKMGYAALNTQSVLDKVKAEIIKNRDRDITGSDNIDAWLEGYRLAFNESLAIIDFNKKEAGIIW